jgi:Rrf2 family protein
MMTQTVEYALRAVTTLAWYDGASATTEELAGRTKVPLAYLAKILQGLAKAGLIRTQRGVGGGVTLNRSPSELKILDVVNAVEPIRRFKTCPLEIHGRTLCALHSKLDAALAALERAFDQVTLADILNDANPNKPLCSTDHTTFTPCGESGASRMTLGVKGKK